MNQDSRLAQINLLILAKIFWTQACAIIVFRYQLKFHLLLENIMICAWSILTDHKLFEDGIAVIFDRFSFNKFLTFE